LGSSNRAGEIVLLDFPYTNAKGSKVRPAVILYDVDLDEQGRLIGVEILYATQKYSLSDIFNLSTQNLILDDEMALSA